MKNICIVLLVFGGLLAEKEAWAQNEKQGAAPAAAKEAAKPIPSQEELEAKFKAMLTKANLSGRWALIKEGVLGEEKEDKYHIVSVGKVSGDSWVVNAKMKYGEREFIAPLPVKVKWAGDTAVLSVDNLQMPGGRNSYSARVLFYENTYAGTWFGGAHGGLLNGIISNEKQETTGTETK